jgi:predicted nuclease of restriction endonuclease-like (RecB) superfamily
MSNLINLAKNITETHSALQQKAYSAINKTLIIRNWLIGMYIVEYEQQGEDRAAYGTGLLKELAASLKEIKGLDERSLRRFRQFYIAYQYIGTSLSLETNNAKWGSLTPILKNIEILGVENIRGSLTTESENRNLRVPADKILTKLSYTHLEQLIGIEDDLKRTFYEIECIKGTWSVRELKRQISSLYYERSGLSAKPNTLSELTQLKTDTDNPTAFIKNIYAFEFLDIASKEVIEESDLETALLDNLHQFIIELGNGFCLEARQKRILIGDTYYFIDLVFYHRILKCHVLIELKIGEFKHEDIGQLNTYLNYYKAEITEPTDNPPIGLLLVAQKDHALVKYATAGMDEHLFVQQYMVALPSVEELQNQIQTQLNNWK